MLQIWKEIAVQFQVVTKPGTAYLKGGMIMSTRKVFFGAGLWILLLAFAGCAAVQPGAARHAQDVGERQRRHQGA